MIFRLPYLGGTIAPQCSAAEPPEYAVDNRDFARDTCLGRGFQARRATIPSEPATLPLSDHPGSNLPPKGSFESILRRYFNHADPSGSELPHDPPLP